MSAAIGSASTAQAAPVNQFAQMESADFIRVLVSQLSNQDPFEPQDSGAMLEQLSSLRNIESQLSLQEKLEQMLVQNQISVAGALIGRRVTGLDGAGAQVEGLVSSVRVQNGKAVLGLADGRTIDMSRVLTIAADDGSEGES
ncbi:MAG: flagellar basal body rod modification protein [Phycisphaeraceae bacterium]|nr:flagellar basal body rod modification protein [Phycisphaeraceae bacterium]